MHFARLLAVCGFAALAMTAPPPSNAQTERPLVERFTIDVRADVLRDLEERLSRTRWPDQLPGTGWTYGADTAYLRELVAYCTRARKDESAPGERSVSAEADQLSSWQIVWNDTYRETQSTRSADFNLAGWKSSYTGESLAVEEMRRWVEDTVDRILELNPRSVLEIGCGTGLLLLRLAPRCERYVGADVSAEALRVLGRQVEQDRARYGGVELREAEGRDLGWVEEQSVDTVVLNSVVQYFPSVSYLLEVLEGVIGKVKAGGAVFVGDVRSLELLEAFHLLERF